MQMAGPSSTAAGLFVAGAFLPKLKEDAPLQAIARRFAAQSAATANKFSFRRVFRFDAKTAQPIGS